MNGKWRLLVLAGIGALSSLAAPLYGAGAMPSPVVGQSLTGLEVPGKISAVLWTRRENSYTLQINRLIAPEQRHRDAFAQRDKAQIALSGLRNAEIIQVWLLRADGSHIEPTRRWETPDEEKIKCVSVEASRCPGYEISFAYHAYLADHAVAVAIRFGETYRIEGLDQLSQ